MRWFLSHPSHLPRRYNHGHHLFWRITPRYGEVISTSNILSTRLPFSLRKTGPSLLDNAAALEKPVAAFRGRIGKVDGDSRTGGDDLEDKTGTVITIFGVKTWSSLRIFWKPNAAILGWIATPCNKVMRSRMATSAANLPRYGA